VTLWASEDVKQGKSTRVLYFDVDTDYIKFLQEDMKALLPYLQNFAETGTLEPAATESPLHGVNEKIAMAAVIEDPEKRIAALLNLMSPPLQGEEERINAIAKSSAKRVLDIIEAQNKQIEVLQNLVKEWRDFVVDVAPNFTLEQLEEQTAQLLGEESQS
jgi:hypothetical protein